MQEKHDLENIDMQQRRYGKAAADAKPLSIDQRRFIARSIEEETERLASWLRKVVRDSDTSAHIFWKVADALANKELPMHPVVVLLECMNNLRIRKRGAYFVTGAKRIFREHGLPWIRPEVEVKWERLP